MANLEFEFRSLPFDFIESHDPEAIIEYVKVLQALGRTEEAFTFLSQHVTQTSRPYIRRQAALWRAQIYEEKGHAREAENAFIEALITAHQDPEAYLALIHHYHTRGESALAQALTGVMKAVILPSPQWREYSDDLQTYIRDHLPESLRDGEYSRDDLMTVIKLWIGRGQLEESSKYWLPIIRLSCEDRGRYIFFGDERKSLKKILLDLVNDLSMSPDQRLQYYKALYNHRKDWSHNGFYSDAVVEEILYTLNKELRDPDQAFELAQFVVDKQRESGYFERHNVNTEALKVVVEGHLLRKDTEQAIIVFIDLIRQFKWDNTSHTLQDLMMQLAPFMNTEYATCTLESMFGNFTWVHFVIPDMIGSLTRSFGEKSTAEMIKMALQAESKAVSEWTSWNLTWFLKKPLSDRARFDHLILEALLTHPSIESEWQNIRKEIKTEDSGNVESASLPTGLPQLSELLSSINIHQQNVASDGYCMWHALSYGLHRTGVADMSAMDLQQALSQFTHTNTYAPDHWGTSEHLAVAAQHFNVPIIEILQTGAGQLSGTLFQPSTLGSATEMPVLELNHILSTLQTFHAQHTPVIIMINNTPLNTDGALELSDSNHWSAGTWLPSFAPTNVQFNASEFTSPYELQSLFLIPIVVEAASASVVE